MAAEQLRRVLALSNNQHHHFAPLEGVEGIELIETDDIRPETVASVNPDLLLTPGCDAYTTAGCVEEARKRSIPSLLVMDGVLEWRHEWENPRFGAGDGTPYDQPITTDKVACLGWQSARTLEAWGNGGKCEIVGIPRFDRYLTDPVPAAPDARPRRLLIMTANTPGFTPEQTAQVERSLIDLKQVLDNQSVWEPIWRVRRGLDERLGLTDNFPDLRGKPLREALEQAHAILTTPSTTLLESMLAKRPAALLDYTNSPLYIPAAWVISAQDHIAPVLAGLETPTAAKLAFQDEMLHNALECYTPALDRLVQLMKFMADAGRTARANGQPLHFPDRIVPFTFGGHAVPSEHFDLEQLYPNHPIYKMRALNDVQLALVHARKELDVLRKQVQSRSLGYWIGIYGTKLYERIGRRFG